MPATFEAPRDDADTITTTARAVHGQGLRQSAADPATSDRGQLQVDHLGEERMRQRDLDALRALRHHEEATSLERLEHGGAGDLLEEVEPELPRDCEQLDDIALVILQTSEPFLDEELERRRRVHERLREVPHPVALDEVAGVTRRLDELAQHSRVAGRRVDELLEAVLRDRRTEHAVEKRFDGVRCERSRLEPAEVAVVDERAHLVVVVTRRSDRAHDERSAGVHQRDEQRTRQVVEVVDVVHHHDPAASFLPLLEGSPSPVEEQGTIELALGSTRPGHLGRQQVRRARRAAAASSRDGPRRARRAGRLRPRASGTRPRGASCRARLRR